MSKMTDMEKKQAQEDEFTIKPEAVTPALDTSKWPLLLKNFDRRTSRRQSLALEVVLLADIEYSPREDGPFYAE